jgi:hypothetical protein
MTDLVQRLESYADDVYDDTGELMLEASAEITRLRAEVERLSADARRLDLLASNPRYHLDCEVLKFGMPGKWRVWKLKGKYGATMLGEGDTPRAAIDASTGAANGT